MSHGYRYVGNGQRWHGVPARDLTQEEFERLGPLEQRAVREGGGYEAVKAKDAKAAERQAEAERLAAQENAGEGGE